MSKSLPNYLVFLLTLLLSACSHDQPALSGDVPLQVSKDEIRLTKQGNDYVSEPFTVDYSDTLDVLATPSEEPFVYRPEVRVLSEEASQKTLQLVYPNAVTNPRFYQFGQSVRFLSVKSDGNRYSDIEGVSYTDIPVSVISSIELSETVVEFSLSTFSEPKAFPIDIFGVASQWRVSQPTEEWLSFVYTEGSGSDPLVLVIDGSKVSAANPTRLETIIFLTDEETGFEMPIFITGFVNSAIVPVSDQGNTIVLPRPEASIGQTIKLFTFELNGPEDHEWYIDAFQYRVFLDKTQGIGPTTISVLFNYSASFIPEKVNIQVRDRNTGTVTLLEKYLEFVEAVSPVEQEINFSFLRNNPSADQLSKTLSIVGPNQNWEIISNNPWLEFSSTSGLGPSDIEMSLNLDLLTPEAINQGIETVIYLEDTDTEIRTSISVSISSYEVITLSEANKTLEYTLPRNSEDRVKLGTFTLSGPEENAWRTMDWSGTLSIEPARGTGPGEVDVFINLNVADTNTDWQTAFSVIDTTRDHESEIRLDFKFVDAVYPAERIFDIVVPLSGGNEAENLNRTLSLEGIGNSWTIESDLPWLSLSLMEGTGPMDVTLTFNPNAMDDPNSASGIITVIDTETGLRSEVEINFTRSDSVVLAGNGQSFYRAIKVTGNNDFIATLNIIGNEANDWDIEIFHSGYVSAETYSGTGPASINLYSRGDFTFRESVYIILTDRVTKQSSAVTIDLDRFRAYSIQGDNNGEFTFSKPGAVQMAPIADVQFEVVGTHASEWKLSTDADWFNFSRTSGFTGGQVDVYVHTIEPGFYESTFTLTDVDSGHTETYIIKGEVLAVAEDRLMLESVGIALSQFAGEEQPSKTIKVSSGLGQTEGTWTATTDAPWLTITGTGKINGDLVLTADSSMLDTDMLYEATVNVTSPELPNLESLQVAFWVGNEFPTTKVALEHRKGEWAMDPIRPYVYLGDGSNSIDVYHLYTNQVVRTIEIQGGLFGKLSVSSNGAQLYAYDMAQKAIQVIDLTNDGIVATWPLNRNVSGNIGVLRINGAELLMTSHGEVFETATGNRYFVPYSANDLTFFSSLGIFCEVGRRFNACYEVTHWNLLDNASSNFIDGISSDAVVVDLAFNPITGRYYTANQYMPELSFYGLNNFDRLGALPLTTASIAIEVGPNGNIYSANSGIGLTTDVTVFDKNHVHLGSFDITENEAITSKGIAISSDGKVLMALTNRAGDTLNRVIIQPLSF